MILLYCAVCVIKEKRDAVMFRRIVVFALTVVHSMEIESTHSEEEIA